MSRPPLMIALMGPTASGKTELAEEIATRLDAQLINADAFQIYRGMSIGTAKPKDAERYRLVDIRDPSESFGVGEFVELASAELKTCWDQNRNVVVVGGTGLYIRALFEEYADMSPAPDPDLREALNKKSLDELVFELRSMAPDLAGTLDLKNRVRVQRSVERIQGAKPSLRVSFPLFKKIKLAVARDPTETSERITRRVQAMLNDGWLQEVKQLIEAGYTPTDPGFRALGYKAMWQHLAGEVELEEATTTTIVDTRRYAKRQRTWLRSEPNLVMLDSVNALDGAMSHIECLFL